MNPIHFFTLGYFQEYLIVGIIFGIIIGTYSFFRIRYSLKSSDLSKNKKRLINFIIPILAFIFCLNIWSNVSILTLYLFISSVIADIIFLIYKYLIKEKFIGSIPKLHKKGIIVLIIFAAIIIGSVYGINHIELTEYNLTSEKIDDKSYSIVFVSDTHYGTIQDKQLLKDTIPKINALKPDLVVLGGDIVDERTTNSDMKEVFNEFGKINSTYGTYYVFGNHDTQPYETDYENGNRTFTDKELNQSIKENNITILSDEKTTINDDIVLVGRSDAGWDSVKERVNVSEILNESDLSQYIIVLDHQPLDYKANSKIGVDLQLSGHTHGGQVFPYAIMYNAMDYLNYGEYKIEDMDMIVSSGLAGWGWSMRNEAKCEYVLITIEKN